MTFAVTAIALLAGAAGIVTLVLSSREGVDASALIRAVGASAVVGVLGLVLLWTRVDLFGTIHLGYLGLTLTLPMLGIAVVVQGARGERQGWAIALGAVLVIPGLVGLYATHVEPFRLRVDEQQVTVSADRGGEDPVRIAVLADLQTNQIGSFERKAIDRLLATEPDVILVPGDLFQSSPSAYQASLPELQGLLARLRAPGGVFVVPGDVDVYSGGVGLAFVDNPDAVILINEVATTRVGDRVLRIGGTELDYTSPAAQEVRHTLEDEPDDGSIRILLSHRPDTVFGLNPDSRVDLTVAGHTHGGQVVVPVVGPLMTMSDVPRSVARGGLHELDGNAIYVSPGVGMERLQAPQLRFNDRPTIGLLVVP